MIDLSQIVTNTNESLEEISQQRPIMLVFLRHFGCVFCRDSLKDLSEKKQFFVDKDVELIFVHMTDHNVADMYFDNFGLSGYKHISDPACDLYLKFGLIKGNFNQLFGLKNMIRGFEATMKGTFISLKQVGDGFQMPGIFMLDGGEVKNSFIHKVASDKPDYESIVNTCLTA